MSVITGPWIKEPMMLSLEALNRRRDTYRRMKPDIEKPLMPPSGLVGRASLTKLKEQLRGLAKLEETPPYHQDDVLYAIEKATKIRYCYVVKGSEWTIWAMERAARLNLDNFGRARINLGIEGENAVLVMDEIDLQLSHVPHMVPAKQKRKTYAEYFGY